MVTQCTACLVWFRVTREQLHAAHGLVRCSACNTVFNALATLRHDMPEGAVLAGSTSPLREESAGGSGVSSPRESEASEFDTGKKYAARQESSATDYGGPPREEPYLGMPIDEAGPDAESGLEFEPEAAEDSDSPVAGRDDLTELELYLASALEDEDLQQLSAAVSGEARNAGAETGSPPSLEQSVVYRQETGRPESELETGEEIFQQGAGGENQDGETPPTFAVERGNRWQRRIWGLVLGLAALVLAGQIVYAQRDALGRIFGLPRSEPMLNQYAITGAELNAAQQPGGLVLKGALVNQGRRAQPLPLIRVTLTDRYGDIVGARVLSPGQYGAGPGTLLHAHQRFMFHVKLADPGSSAVGFSLVLCKHHRHSILCQDS